VSPNLVAVQRINPPSLIAWWDAAAHGLSTQGSLLEFAVISWDNRTDQALFVLIFCPSKQPVRTSTFYNSKLVVWGLPQRCASRRSAKTSEDSFARANESLQLLVDLEEWLFRSLMGPLAIRLYWRRFNKVLARCLGKQDADKSNGIRKFQSRTKQRTSHPSRKKLSRLSSWLPVDESSPSSSQTTNDWSR